MALPSVLSGQETINPFAQLALQNALQQSQESAQQQYTSALEQLATTPAMTQQVDSTLNPETNAAPASLANNPNRRGFNNLGFSNLNAYAAATPQLSFTPTTVPGGGMAQGITNFYNMQQQRQAQDNIMQMMQQQQAAAQQQAMAEQQAKVLDFQRRVSGLRGIPGMTDERAMGLVASGQDAQIYGAFKSLADAQAMHEAGRFRDQMARQYVPSLAQGAGSPVPINPYEQMYLNTLYGAPAAAFNQYQPMLNRVDLQQKAGSASLTKAEADVAPKKQSLDIAAKEESIRGQKLDNALKAINNQFAPQEKQIALLLSQGKVDEAATKKANLVMAREALANLDYTTATEQDINRINGLLAISGITHKIPLPTAPEIKVINDVPYYNTPQGLKAAMQEVGGGLFNGPKQQVPITLPGIGTPAPIVVPGIDTPVPIVMPGVDTPVPIVVPQTKPVVKAPSLQQQSARAAEQLRMAQTPEERQAAANNLAIIQDRIRSQREAERLAAQKQNDAKIKAAQEQRAKVNLIRQEQMQGKIFNEARR